MLRRAPPYPGAKDMTEVQLHSWLGELSNQLLGILKQQLLQ